MKCQTVLIKCERDYSIELLDFVTVATELNQHCNHKVINSGLESRLALTNELRTCKKEIPLEGHVKKRFHLKDM